MGVLDNKKWPRNCSNSKYNIGHHPGQVHSKKVAPIELKMVPAVTKRKIAHLVQISAQSEQLCKSFALNAIQDGGLFGVGVGEGVIKWRLPDAHTDFIIAVAAEEYGIILCLLIILFFCLIVIRSFFLLKNQQIFINIL